MSIGGVGGALMVLVTGVGVSGRMGWSAVRGQRSGEETEDGAEHPLELDGCTSTLPVQERKMRTRSSPQQGADGADPSQR